MAHRVLDGEAACFEHLNDFAEVFRQGIARAENIEFLLHEEASFVSDEFFRISDINNAPGESNFLDSGAKSLGKSYGFDNNIGPATSS